MSPAVEVVGPAAVAPKSGERDGRVTSRGRAPAMVGPTDAATAPRERATWGPLRYLWPLGLAVVAGRLLYAMVAVARANQPWLAVNVPDDAYYYLEIAQRLARGEGFTLDGVNPTNGFHPLWQGIDALLALVWHGDALVKASLITGYMFFAVAVRPCCSSGFLCGAAWGRP